MKVYKRYENCSFDNFETTQDISILKNAKELDRNVILFGGVGTGKTHLAFAILNSLAEKRETESGYKYYTSDFVEYATIKEIIDNIRRCWAKDAANFDFMAVNRYKTITLLIIDEIGVQYGSDSERIELYEIFNERYNNMLPTIAISNYNRQQIEKTLGLRITDRLFGGAKIFEFNGKSKR